MNGAVATIGQSVTETDVVEVDGRRVRAEPIRTYMLNKPMGVVSTASDPEGRRTVLDGLPDDVRLYPIGRLDIDTTGLLLITNDGGPGQFAAMTPIQTIVFFGPETPALYRSWSPHAHAFFTALPCAPCLTAYNHRSSPCDGDNQCLKRILPGEVLAKARDMLKRATPAAVDAA